MAQYSDASPILQLHANGKHHCDVRLRCPLWVKSGHCAVSGRCPLYPQKAAIHRRQRHVRFVPKAHIPHYSITSPEMESTLAGMVRPSALAAESSSY
jgi:hypothetical protein